MVELLDSGHRKAFATNVSTSMEGSAAPATSLNDGSLSESVPMRGSDTGLSDPNAGSVPDH